MHDKKFEVSSFSFLSLFFFFFFFKFDDYLKMPRASTSSSHQPHWWFSTHSGLPLILFSSCIKFFSFFFFYTKFFFFFFFSPNFFFFFFLAPNFISSNRSF